jgi:hypothetical protein
MTKPIESASALPNNSAIGLMPQSSMMPGAAAGYPAPRSAPASLVLSYVNDARNSDCRALIIGIAAKGVLIREGWDDD